MNFDVADAEKDLKIHPVLSVQVLRKFIYLFEKKKKKLGKRDKHVWRKSDNKPHYAACRIGMH